MNWDDAQEFIRKLNQRTGQRFRLPSEAEWEYAARAGCETPFNVGGHCRSKIEASEANFDGTYIYNGSAKGSIRWTTLRTGSFSANGWGLHDMHGNVNEWVQDCFLSYAQAPSDGSAVESANCSTPVFRGGAWLQQPQTLRSAYRFSLSRDLRISYIGFRLARTVF